MQTEIFLDRLVHDEKANAGIADKGRWAVSTISSIEPGEYRPLKLPSGSGFSEFSSYGKTSASQRLLRDTAEVLGVTIYGLGRLLGLPFSHNIYRWLDGSARPSQRYVLRLARLLLLHSAGLKMIAVHHINWDDDGEIVYKERVVVGGGWPKVEKKVATAPRSLMDKFRSQTPR